MRKSQFLALLQSGACATADAALASVGHTTRGCPYIKRWLDHYKNQNAQHLIRAINKYAPETRQARTAHEAILIVDRRVQHAALSWARTGKVSGLPPELQSELMREQGGGGGFLGAVASFASSGFGSAILGFLGGGKSDDTTERGSVQRKAQNGDSSPAHDAAGVKDQLGSGQPLDSRVQGQMSSAFGYDFSSVRVHTDSRAGELSSQLNARAFTIGGDVAFAGGEYKPGTPVGDALIAHELAHVVQQDGGHQSAAPMQKGSDSGQLEDDADRSAVGAVVSIWSGGKTLANLTGTSALPRLKSGLRLQGCRHHASQPDLHHRWQPEDVVRILAQSGDQNVITEVFNHGFSILSFNNAFDKWRNDDGTEEEVPIPTLRGNTNRDEKKIRLRDSLTNQQATQTLFHESHHLTSSVHNGLEQEIQVRIETERFLIRRGWPPAKPSYRNPDGTINEAAIRADIMGSPHYNPTGRTRIGRRYTGDQVMPASRWRLP
jgi:hypothetical protein